ncbi:MAG: hypothetical protein EOO25_22195 [Comamonadaceae bacterium]|nr:MAG: hypothetical protein EOO25_22195 [Comamonadaceae bacterium]
MPGRFAARSPFFVCSVLFLLLPFPAASLATAFAPPSDRPFQIVRDPSMNKNLYRIVFNQQRGQLMVVAETAAAHGGGASGETSGQPGRGVGEEVRAGEGLASDKGTGPARLRPLPRLLALGLGLMALLTPALQPAHAQIVADRNAPGGQRPTILGTANGLPQVNIQAPSAAGVAGHASSSTKSIRLTPASCAAIWKWPASAPRSSLRIPRASALMAQASSTRAG